MSLPPMPCLRVALLGLVAALASGCGALISPAKEVEIGRGVDGELRKQYQLVDADDPVAVFARDFVAPLQAGSAKFRNPSEIGGFKVSVIADDKLVNAFAAPGGFTYISTGLLLSAESCAEIAGVMGHELAHVTQKHGVKAIEQAMAAQQLADMILGQGTLSGQAALTILNILQSTKFSRDDEAEADGVGLQIAAGAAYNPYGLAAFFQKLLKLEGAGMPEILSSHPATDSRIRAVKTEIQKRYGTRYKEAEVKTQPCQKTKIQLGDVKQRIRDKRLKLAPKAGQT
ncbi:MAG: M48 family metalloprotease [bacterium]